MKSEEMGLNSSINGKIEVQADLSTEQPNKQLTILTGWTTSRVEQALKAKSPYPARVFLKVELILSNFNKLDDNQEHDVPVFFRIKEKRCQVEPCLECNYPKKGNWEKQANCQTQEIQHQVKEVWIKPKIEKGSYLEVKGYFNHSNNSSHLSFTAYSYQILNPNFEINNHE